MAKKIIWSFRAIVSFDRIIDYLENERTVKEIEKFVSNTKQVLQQMESGTVKFKSSGKKNIHEVLVKFQNCN